MNICTAAFRHLATALLLLAGATVQAASLTLVPSATAVAKNSVFTVGLKLDAMNAPGAHPGLYGGEILVSFDKTLLNYGGFTLASGVSYFSAPAVSTAGNTQTVHLGFDNAADLGAVGTFSFTAIGNAGSTAAIGLTDADDFSGSFASYTPTYQRFYPTFTPTQVAVVPLPASLWLLGTALGGIAVRRRFRRAAD